jgi:hypothetical protein
MHDRRAVTTRGRRLCIAALPVLVAALATSAAAGSASPTAPPAQVPDPVTCEGYPEKRVYLENQSWWEPQPGPASHPGTGDQGHIHVGTCFPLFQKVSGETLSFDLDLQLHNMPGHAFRLRVDDYKFYNQPYPLSWDCPGVQCAQRIHVDFPLSQVPNSGWHNFNIFLMVKNKNGQIQRNVTRWFLYIDNGKPRKDFPGPMRLGGDSWFENPGGTKYAAVYFEGFSWDENLKLRPLSGTWSPRAKFRRDEGIALVDPKLHANPIDRGVEILGDTGAWDRVEAFSIDTTKLADGRHRLLLATCEKRPAGRHCGVLVVPFLVQNGVAGEEPADPPHTGLHAHGPIEHHFTRSRRTLIGRLVFAHTPIADAVVSCGASVRQRALARFPGRARNGVARCRWRVPAWGGGKRLKATITVRAGDEQVKQSFSVRLPRRPHQYGHAFRLISRSFLMNITL